MSKKFYLITPNMKKVFNSKERLENYIRNSFDIRGGFDWVEEIRDSEGNEYGCDWSLEIVKI